MREGKVTTTTEKHQKSAILARNDRDSQNAKQNFRKMQQNAFTNCNETQLQLATIAVLLEKRTKRNEERRLL